MKGRRAGGGGPALLELLVLVTVAGILAATAIPMYYGYTGEAEKKAARYDLKLLQSVMENYYAEKQYVPPAASGAVTGWDASYSSKYTYVRRGDHDYRFKSVNSFGGVYISIDQYGAISESTDSSTL
ncbi:MAG: type IV pilin protein [Bacillota bacterium]